MIVLGSLLLTALAAEAKTWRVNRTPGVHADFTQLQLAHNNAEVRAGDTIYLEGAEDLYNSFALSKRLVIIGTGYFLAENPGLQYRPLMAQLGSLTIDSSASGTELYGLKISNLYINSDVDNIRIIGCSTSLNGNTSRLNQRMSNWVVNKCYLYSVSYSGANYVFENLQLTNCIIASSVNVPYASNTLFRNNVVSSVVTLANAYVANNIFLTNSTGLSFVNCAVKHNLSSTNNLPADNNNQRSVDMTTVYRGAANGTAETRFQLIPGSPAIGAGEPVNGVTPDIGPFGTPDPYRLSGIPPIPTIYALTVPSAIPTTATSMTVTVSTRSNN